MLEGIRVVSFTHFLQGPSASQLLADLGAEVIKVEPPAGAFERSWSGPDAFLEGVSVFFLLANRNVKSMSIDLKAEGAHEVLMDLIDSADVVIESFRPGAMDRLGLGYEALSKRNPRLVYASLSGYGSDGPYRNRPGQDVLLQAMSGLAAGTGRAGHPATPAGASLIDEHGAVLAAFGIVSALLAREQSGAGMRVESNLLSAALDLQIEPLAYFANGFRHSRSESGVASPYYRAPYGVFQTADGEICLSLNPLPRIASALSEPWFESVPDDEVFARREEVNERIAIALIKFKTEELIRRFDAHGVWWAPVNNHEDVLNDPQVAHNESFLTFEHPTVGQVTVLGHPLKYDGIRPGVRSIPPALGEHTHEVLATLGYSTDKIDRLVQAGVINESEVARA